MSRSLTAVCVAHVTVCDACGSIGHIKRQCPTVKRPDDDAGMLSTVEMY